MDNRDFTSLEVWKEAHNLAIKIYKFCDLLPTDEKYNQVSQIKRSVSSIAANIAEGYGRFYFQDNISFCRKARGSLDETRNHLILIRDLKFSSVEKCDELLRDCILIRRLLNGYINHLNRKQSK